MQFAYFDIDAFLHDHWQKKPLLIRSPWKAWRNPLKPDELAGLACEDGIEARLIEKAGKDWKVEHGPLPEERFEKLGKAPWTLLVQAVDQQVPDVAALIEPFRFIPNWRIDDVMVSYASDGGGVGAHFDQYDVFLIQGLGQRRWRLGQHCNENSALLPHEDLRLLADFDVTGEWVLEPGDMLYVPPGIAHDGVAVGDDCMTYSIGFRAPSRAELLGAYVDDLLAGMTDDDRYADPGLKQQANPGEITPEAISALHAMMTQALTGKTAFARWFGEYSSTPKYPDMDWRPEEPITVERLREAFADGSRLVRNPASRFSFVREGAAVMLFVDGESHECTGETAALARALCASEQITASAEWTQSARAMELIALLLNQGSIACERD